VLSQQSKIAYWTTNRGRARTRTNHPGSLGGVIIREATTEADISAALDVYVDVAAEGVWIGTEAPIDREARMAKWLDTFLGNGGSVMFVVDVGTGIAGAAVLDPQGACGSGLYEFGMWVDKVFRGKGAGSALVEACIKWAEQQGAHKISLLVSPHNQPARALYRKYGFEEEGYLKRHWRRKSGEIWDSIVMGLLLDQS
jgi:RimJ/RimL family protein N-acetyltransferase